MFELEDVAKFLMVLASICGVIAGISAIGLIIAPSGEEAAAIYGIVLIISLSLAATSSTTAFIFRGIDKKQRK